MGDEYCHKCKSRLTTCAECHGRGTTYQGDLLHGYSYKPCLVCHGTGKLCPSCGSNWG